MKDIKDYLENPTKLDANTLLELEALVKKVPSFKAAQQL